MRIFIDLSPMDTVALSLSRIRDVAQALFVARHDEHLFHGILTGIRRVNRLPPVIFVVQKYITF